MGDRIQAAKAGILEVGDVYAVNKADRDGAEQVRRDLRMSLALTQRRDDAWRPPVLLLTARDGQGVAPLLDEADRHRAWLESSGELGERRSRRAAAEVEAVALGMLRDSWRNLSSGRLAEVTEEVVAGRLDPWTAAERLVASAG
jgi:LAO/AO transport system kinase